MKNQTAKITMAECMGSKFDGMRFTLDQLEIVLIGISTAYSAETKYAGSYCKVYVEFQHGNGHRFDCNTDLIPHVSAEMTAAVMYDNAKHLEQAQQELAELTKKQEELQAQIDESRKALDAINEAATPDTVQSMIAVDDNRQESNRTDGKFIQRVEVSIVEDPEAPSPEVFEVGETYRHGWIGDSNMFSRYKVLSRTAKRVTLEEQSTHGKPEKITRGISHDTDGNEYVMPHGRYSMAPRLNSAKKVEAATA